MLSRGGFAPLRRRVRALLIVAVPYTALPFLMMSWGALHFTAGLSAVLRATAPMFAALVARFVLGERLGAWRAAGAAPAAAVRVE